MVEQATYQEGQEALSDGDVLVVYSDGVTEAEANGEWFGEERLLACLRAVRTCDVGAIVDAVLNAVSDYAGPVPQDDITVLTVRRVGGG